MPNGLTSIGDLTHYDRILGDDHPELERIGDGFANLPERRPDVARRAADWKAELIRVSRDNSDASLAITAALTRLKACQDRPKAGTS